MADGPHIAQRKVTYPNASDFGSIWYTNEDLELDDIIVTLPNTIFFKSKTADGRHINKKLSCRREAARCFVFVCSQLHHTYSVVFIVRLHTDARY